MGKTKRKKRTIARICSMIGVSLLILVILICIPLTLPRLTGFDIYTVVTGSMEPAIPVGSLIYVREEAPAELMEGVKLWHIGAIQMRELSLPIVW